MPDWQPIETAPMDGRYIIVARFKGVDELLWVKHSRWITEDEVAEIYGGDVGDYAAGWTDGNDEDELAYPTHWMSLFKPPEVNK